MIKLMTEDLIRLALNTKLFDVYAHGANCHNCMGAGIAGIIANRIPAVYRADITSEKTPEQKLGSITECEMINNVGHKITFVNLYTQFYPGKNLDYNALIKSLMELKSEYGGKQLRFAFPWIGCGIAGGDKQVVHDIISDILKDEDVTIVEKD